MKMPTKAEALAAIQRAEKATKGPWILDKYYQMFIWGPNHEMVADDGQDEEGTLTRMRGVGANLPLKDNGDFIAAARTDVPTFAQAYIEAMVILDRLMKENPHGERCSCNWCALLIAYHGEQEKAG